MQRNIAEVANETREVALFDFWGGQLPVTCERCDICTVTGEGTSFWNTVRHSITINLVLAVFLREVPIRTYVMSNTTNQFVTSEGKRSIAMTFRAVVESCIGCVPTMVLWVNICGKPCPQNSKGMLAQRFMVMIRIYSLPM